MRLITVLVVDDDRSTRQLVRQVLARDDGIVVVAEAENGRQAVALAGKFRPDVVIMDIEMPELDGCAATTEIMAAFPHTRVVFHSSASRQSEVERALANGAIGFVGKTNTHELCRAVRAVSQGLLFSAPDPPKD